MKSYCLAIALLFPLVDTVCSQDTTESGDDKVLSGFEFLKQFEGRWKTISRPAGQDSGGIEGVMNSRALGNQWVVCEYDATVNGIVMDVVQRIGYDEKTKKFIGTWADSMSKHVWKYDGVLESEQNKLTLYAEGPDWNDPNKTAKYRDIYKFASADKINSESQIQDGEGNWTTFMNGMFTRDEKKPVSTGKSKVSSVMPLLMFDGKAEEAMNFYKSVFPELKIETMNKYGPGQPGKEGTVQVATFSIDGQRVKCIDSPIKHDFTFTPSFSLFVECDTEEELKKRFEKLSVGGKVMMPLGDHGFSKKFGWTSDKFGVSWQLNLQN